MFLSRAGRVSVGVLLSATAVGCATDGAEQVPVEPDAAPATPPASSQAPAAPSADEPSAATTDVAGRAFDWQRLNFGFVSAYLLVTNAQAVVVDTGVAGSANDIETALTDLGMGWYAVEHVILTHRHDDHIGDIQTIADATEAEIHAGEGDIPSIPLSRPIQPVGDGDEVFGLQIVQTPGHTPGHISVLDPVGGVLIAGDALVGRADGGGVAGPDAAYTQDMATAVESVRKLAGFDFDTVVFGHGEPVEADGGRQVKELARTL